MRTRTAKAVAEGRRILKSRDELIKGGASERTVGAMEISMQLAVANLESAHAHLAAVQMNLSTEKSNIIARGPAIECDC